MIGIYHAHEQLHSYHQTQVSAFILDFDVAFTTQFCVIAGLNQGFRLILEENRRLHFSFNIIILISTKASVLSLYFYVHCLLLLLYTGTEPWKGFQGISNAVVHEVTDWK